MTQRIPRKWTEEEKSDIVRRYYDGQRFSVIAEIYHDTAENVRGVLRRTMGAKQGAYREKESDISSSVEQGDDYMNIVCTSPRIKTEEDILKQFKIDTDKWRIDKFTVKTSEGYRKDRSVSWHVRDGSVYSGDVEDSGKMLVVPMYHVEVKLIRKTAEIRESAAIISLMREAKSFAPVYPKIDYPVVDGGCLFEIDLMDVHFGRLTWEEESGENYDIKIAKHMLEDVTRKLLLYAFTFPVSRILLPVGNDFFNVDNKNETTVHGTPQQEDTRWQKTFRAGREILVSLIDMCSTIAPVDVLIIPGNHDEQRSFYLGDALYSWYHANPNVTVDNSAAARKYYAYGTNLIGFTHGYYEKLEKLPLLMPIEVPKLWADSTYREWHTGDKHKKRDLIVKASEDSGMVVRILRSLAEQDAWTFDKGYKSLQAAEAFMWHPTDGMIAQFTAVPQKYE